MRTFRRFKPMTSRQIATIHTNSKTPYKVLVIGLKYTGERDVEDEILQCKTDSLFPDFSSLTYDAEKISKYDGVLMWNYGTVSAQDLQIVKQLNPQFKGIVRIGTGYDNVDYREASKLGIPVSNVPDYAVEEVADSTLSLLLMMTRRTYYSATQLRYHNHLPVIGDLIGGKRSSTLTVGVIGLGNIGSAFALRAKALGMRVIFHDPYIRRGVHKSLGLDHRCESLQELLEQSDVVSIHCNLTGETRKMINRQTIQWMKSPGSYLINTARGAIVEEEALVEALEQGNLAGAALDVLEREPYTDGHLQNVKNLIVTSHCAFYSDQSFSELRRKAAEEMKRMLTGQKPWYIINTNDKM